LKTMAAVLLGIGLLLTAAAGLALRAEAQEQPSPKLEDELREMRAELKKMRAEIDKLKQQLGQPEAGRKPAPAEKDGKDQLVLKVYQVADVVDPADMDELVSVITKVIEPKYGSPRGTTVSYFSKTHSLVINQSAEVHERVQALLDSLRKAKAEQGQK